MRYFQKKRVLITGGSSGIGRAAANLMASWGADIAVAARDPKKLEDTIEELSRRRPKGTFIPVVLDVADKAAIKEKAPEILQQLGGLDVLINNAGIVQPGYFQDIEDEAFEAMMNVNYFGAVNLSRALLPHFIAQGHGHICNVSSFAGLIGIFGYTAYAASKFAVAGFSDCLRQELLTHNIGVSVVFPADTDTPQLAYEDRFKPAETRAIAGNVKLMQPEEVAHAMLEGIASDRYHIVPGHSARLNHFLYRHFPWLVRWVMDKDVKRSAQGQA